MIKTILTIVFAIFLSNVSKAQTEEGMKAEQIKIREEKVEVNYYQKGEGEITLLFIHGWCIDGKY